MPPPEPPPAEPRRPGRPRSPEPRNSLSTWVPSRDHDRLIKIAERRGVSVSSLVRDLVRSALRSR